MLVLTRKTGEAVQVDPDYRLEVLGCAEGVATVELTRTGVLRGDRRLFKLRRGQGISLPAGPEGAGWIEVLCCLVTDHKTRLGFEAPREVGIVREEVVAREAADRAIGSLSNMAPEGVSR